DLVTASRDALGRELAAGPRLWSQLGERFTRERAALELVFACDPARDAGHDLEPGFALLARRDARVRERLAPELAPVARACAASLVHMHANRLLHASQRAQELVLHDFLRRLHAARRALQKRD
ncbi:MAG: lantibiotic dehydratase C-terminal domain-containing protein, partial [Acidobacteriota bacterium]